MSTLYQLSSELRAMLDTSFDPDTGEALPAFEECRALIGNKAGQVAAYILNVEADAAAAKAAMTRIKSLCESYERKAEHLREYLAQNMAVAGITEIKAEDRSFVVKLYPERDESVELDESATFPPELCADPKPPAPSKAKIRAAIAQATGRPA